MSLCIRVNSEKKTVLKLVVVDGIQVSSLKVRIKDKFGIVQNHSQLPTALKLKIRVVFFEKTFQKLRFTQMELVKRVLSSLIIEVSVNIKAIGRPIA